MIVNGERVKQARELRAYTQKELGEKVGVNQSAIARIETSDLTPTKEVIQRLAISTGFPLSFFTQESYLNFPLGSLLFRGQASVNLREKYEASQFGRTIYEVYQSLESNVKPPSLEIPCLSESPIEAAKMTRSNLGLSPDNPIKDLINLIERQGVIVLAIPKELNKRDAYSLWIEEGTSRPVIVISSGKSGDRLRFSIAHELGHIIMHKNKLRGNSKLLELEADQFAGELLAPEKAIRQEITPPVTLFGLAKLKLRWGISIQALIRRAKDLAIINEDQYKYLNKKVSAKGWKKEEPENLSIPVEKPRALSKLAEMIYGSPIDYKRFSQDTKLSTSFLKEVLCAHKTTQTDNLNDRQNKPGSIKYVNFN